MLLVVFVVLLLVVMMVSWEDALLDDMVLVVSVSQAHEHQKACFDVSSRPRSSHYFAPGENDPLLI